MSITLQSPTQNEEQLVADLARLGVSYLSRQSVDSPPPGLTPDQLIASLVCQPSGRVRVAVVALMLARPDYAQYIPKAIKQLEDKQAQSLRYFYTAAVYLQREYQVELLNHLGNRWLDLPDLFSRELGLTGDSPAERLKNLATLHAQWSGETLNWEGTYRSAAQHLLRRWQKELEWKV